MSFRCDGRAPHELRPVVLTRQYTKYAEGSVLIELGETRVLCTVSVVPGVPHFLKNSGTGWLTAEYGMLPRATHDRVQREATKGKQTGRTMEIQRLIGRSLRHCVDFKVLGEQTLMVDCDVLQADGGTRTAAITGACLALADALRQWDEKNQQKKKGPSFLGFVSAVSVGIHQGTPVLDLCYAEDSAAETDMNVVMNEQGGWIEIQGTAEGKAFSHAQLSSMLELAQQGAQQLLRAQREAFGTPSS